MSLETVHQKFRKIEKETTTEKLFFYGYMVAIVLTAIIFAANPSYLTHYQTPLAQFAIIVFTVLAFMAMSLTLFGGGLATGIMMTWLLIKSRDKFYYKNGIIAGKSLSTNDDFLNDLTNGLFPKLIGFIKSYNDPKFEEFESRQLNSENKINQVDKKLETKIDRIEVQAMLDERDANYERKIKVKDLVINKLSNEKKRSERELEEYKRKDAVKKQQIGENIDAQDLNENTKIDDQNTKFERKN